MSKQLYTSLSLATLSAAAMGLGACNSFDPNLGNAPFRCGTDSPRCPDDYTCVTYSADEEICEPTSGGAERPDAGNADDGGIPGLVCNPEMGLEPNESIDDATRITVPTGDSFRLLNLAICPSGDDDYFEFDVPTSNTDVVVEIEYMAVRGKLNLELLKGDGVSIGAGGPVSGNDNILRVAIPNIAQDTYFVHISGEPGIQNNYERFEIILN